MPQLWRKKVGMGKNDPKFEQNKQSWTKSQGKKRIMRKKT
jgi:hypothetical protein